MAQPRGTRGRTQLRGKNHGNWKFRRVWGTTPPGIKNPVVGGEGGKVKVTSVSGCGYFWNYTLQLYVHQVSILRVPLDGC